MADRQRSGTRHKVLVTSGEQRSSLAVVRSLGRAGHTVIVTSDSGRSLSGASRFVSEDIRVPAALRDPSAYIEALVAIVRTHGVDVVLPMTDDAVLAILPHRERFAPAVIPIGNLDAYLAASDKALLQQIAPDFGIAVPRQLSVATPALTVDLSALNFPVVIKPARSVAEHDGQRKRFTVQHAEDADTLRQKIASIDEAAFPLLLQERIVGPGVGIFLLLWGGRRIATFAHRRLREKPPAGGVSVYSESVAPDPDLVDRSEALLTHLGFEGVAMVEYKVDRASGRPYLMEVNGRFWGSLQLAIDAGVDFPALLLAVALDGASPAPPTPKIGVRSRWWWGDFDHLLARVRGNAASLALPADAPPLRRVITDFLKVWRRGDRSQVLHGDDLRPALRETVNWFLRRL